MGNWLLEKYFYESMDIIIFLNLYNHEKKNIINRFKQ